MSAQVYIFPTELRPILKFLLKSIKAKKFEISPKTHSTTTHDWLIALLYLSWSGVELVKGLCKWTCSAYAESLYRHIASWYKL